MEEVFFDKFVQTQVEIADEIMSVEREIEHYTQLEEDMISKRERGLHKNILGYIDDQKETEYAIHYIQIKLQQKKYLINHLKKSFKNRSLEFVQTLEGHYQM